MSSPERIFKPHPLRRIYIVGYGLSVYDFVQTCLSNPPELMVGEEVWGLNNAAHVFRCHLSFDIHTPRTIREEHGEEPGNRHIKNLTKLPHPVVMPRAYDEIPNSIAYPWQEVIDRFSCNYFRCGTSYAIAAAILCGPKEIQLFGCDFNYPGVTHVEAGRPCVEYWIGRAREAGIDVSIPPISTLCDMRSRLAGSPLYGFRDDEQPEFDIDNDGKLVYKGMPEDRSDILDNDYTG